MLLWIGCCIVVLIVKVCNQLRDLVVALAQADFHHINHVFVAEVGRILTLKHLFSAVFSLLDACNLSERYHDERLMGHPLERNDILVDKDCPLIEH